MYNSYVAYQGAAGDAVFYPANNLYWSLSAPAYFGSSIPNAAPVIGGGMLYTLWSNGLAGQYLSNGTVAWFANVSPTLPYMALAYGRLYVVSGNQVIAYGSCNVPHASLLAAIASLRLNMQSGCATALANAAYPTANYSVSVGNSIINTFQAARFNGQNSYVAANAPQINTALGGRNTVSFWMNWGGALNQMPFGFYTYGLLLTGPCFGFDSGNGDVYGTNSFRSVNQLVLVTAVFNNGQFAGNDLLYINGAPQAMSQCAGSSVPRSATQNFQISGLPINQGYLFNGLIANLQIYNTALAPQQVQQLYIDGAAGPPISGGAVAWYPLGGDTNDYAGLNSGYAVGVSFTSQNGMAPSFSNAYSISKVTTLLPLLRYSAWTSNMVGSYSTYPVGVYSWR